MSTLVIKGFPDGLHKNLRSMAEAHRRSITQEAIGILEAALQRVTVIPPAKPLKMKKALTSDEIVRAVRAGRA